MKEPLVSICCITYNHEKFIGQAVEGFLMQKTSFPIEILIHDDASTDKTADIIRSYELKYPDKIKAIYQTENQFTKGIDIGLTYQFPLAKGKYLAICEGDDYWTDPNKLQKQVDFLESHPDYALCFHRYSILEEQTGTFKEDDCGYLFANKKKEGVDIDTEQFLKSWITQPLTILFHKDCLDLSVFKKYKVTRDMQLIYHLMQKGKAYIMVFNGGVYRMHTGGIHSKAAIEKQVQIALDVSGELYRVNKVTVLKKYYLEILQWAITVYSHEKRSFLKAMGMICKYFWISRSVKRCIKQLITFFFRN